MSDVNATEKVALAWAEYIGARIDAEAGGARHRRHIVERVRRQERRRSFEAGYAAALAVMSDPEVLAGIASALREHDAPTHIDGLPDDEYDCCAVAVVKRLRGQG